MLASLKHWIEGDLSPFGRVITAAGPALLVLGYLLVGALVFAVRNARRGPFRDADVEGRGATPIIGMWWRRFFVWSMRPVMALLVWMRLPPNAITTLSLLLSLAAAVAVAAGRFALGGWLFLGSGLCDYLDGRLARAERVASPAGALLDSVLDRYVEGVVYVGLAWYYRETWVLIAVLVALLGALLVPYVRARGEALGVRFDNVGVVQRTERVVIIGLSLALAPIVEVLVNPLEPHPIHRLTVVAVVLLAAATQVSAFQRLLFARRALEPDQQRPPTRVLGRGGLIRNVVAAFVATASDFAVVALLVSRGVASPAIATVLGCVVGGIVNFSMNRIWTFASNQPTGPQAGRYLVVTTSSAALNGGLVAVLLLLDSVPYQLAWLVVRGAVFLTWNFPLQKNYVFLRTTDEPSGA
ncbi:MAG: GtrA family protein [Myxococcales bacterium]|nr:GtrA family protein [Myxococcales bacterium]MCB9577884.1 GtrA family protein [Polyangiaceae bacterium]